MRSISTNSRIWPTSILEAKGAADIFVAATLLIAVFSGPARGEESNGIARGIFTFKPMLGVYAIHDDNIYTTPESAVDSRIFLLNPSLLVEIEPQQHRFELEWGGKLGQYEDSVDDYADRLLAGRAFLGLGLRHKLDFAASIFNGHQNRGSGLSRGSGPLDADFPTEPHEYEDTELDAAYRMGAKGARGRVELRVGSLEREYETSRLVDRQYDRTAEFASIAFFYGFSSTAYFVLDARRKNIDYVQESAGQPSRDGLERRVRAGATWEISGKTTGRVSIGQTRKEFDNPSRGSFSGVSWEADVRWSPREYSYFDLNASDEPQETIGNGDFMDVKTYQLSWTHDWSDSWQSRIAVRLLDEKFVGTTREEEMSEWQIEVLYQMRRWLAFRAGVVRRSNDSSINSFEFDSTVYSIGLEIAP